MSSHNTSTDYVRPSWVFGEAEASGIASTTSHPSADTSRSFHSNQISKQDAVYMLPDDLKEGSRLNLQHHLVKSMYDGVNFIGVTESGLKSGLKVLDVGCGSGIWLAELDRDFPAGDYHGADLSTHEWAKAFKGAGSKIQVVEGNVCARLPYHDNTFDYVHQRFLLAGIPEKSWPDVIKELLRVLKPGGTLDVTEMDIAPRFLETPGQNALDYIQIMTKLFSARGVNISMANDLRRYVDESEGVENVETARRCAPWGWEGQFSQLWIENGRMGASGLAQYASMALGKSTEEWNDFVEKYLQEFVEGKAYTNIFRVYGKKKAN
ncbi:S-adenosyl-L-methionine-dependent methyltransferase [Cladochytrium replicatum]|nr:S-adenosyl-L-methionine-dependent methyltransferase [Cladochytrium replicatum]